MIGAMVWRNANARAAIRPCPLRTGPTRSGGTRLLAKTETDHCGHNRRPRQVHEAHLLLKAALNLRLELRKTLIHPRREPREVQLIQLFEISAIRGVHGVEPVDEFVGDLFA